ncbi:MAG TPA: pseudaminic acid cytidylyltransferase [Victivallales bacterium]|nr:pseudaminic acid cytidylyltransferase [Victivallales bacterium]
MNIAVIPARGGSKRIPGKNIKIFAHKPIIQYSIEAAIKSNLFDKIIVSTDSNEIAEISKKFDAEVPFMRPKNLSDDETPTAPVVRHAVNWVNMNLGTVDYVCCIYATAPFIRISDLISGYNLITKENIETVFPVTTFPYPIFRALKIENNLLEFVWSEHELTRSQDLPETYHDAGQFYWLDAEKLMKHNGAFKCPSPIIIPRFLVNDIDTPEDWETAELLYRTCKQRGIL